MNISNKLVLNEPLSDSRQVNSSENDSPHKVKRVFFKVLSTNVLIYFDSKKGFKKYLLEKLEAFKNTNPLTDKELFNQIKNLQDIK